jgi:hypothetical protein
MNKTKRKNNSKRNNSKNNKTKINKNKIYNCDRTMHEINRWYEKNFEKLGWMILAKNRGYTDKINTYLNSLERLKKSIEYKIKIIHDKDKKHDLKILYYNTEILSKHANKDLK